MSADSLLEEFYDQGDQEKGHQLGKTRDFRLHQESASFVSVLLLESYYIIQAELNQLPYSGVPGVAWIKTENIKRNYL